MMTLNTSVLIALALTLMRRCAEGCVETFPNLTDSSTECNNTMRTCSVTCKRGKIFNDGNYTKIYSCNEDNVWSPSVPNDGCKDKTQALYWILLTAKYHTSVVASYCLEAHGKALNDTIGKLASPYLSFCMNTTGVGNISISNITSTSQSFEITTVLELKLVNMSTVSFKTCARFLKINVIKFIPYDSPINCSTGMTSNITIEDDIVHSYITSCGDHYVLVKDSDDNNYCVSDIPVVGVKFTSYLTQIHKAVVLYCEVQFSSTVEYLYWQQDYRNLTVNNNTRYSGGTIEISSLTIHEATYNDTGYYTCNAVSQSGTGTSLYINLIVGDGVDDQTAVQHTPTSTSGLTGGITETNDQTAVQHTPTSTSGLTGGITETRNYQTLFIAIGAGSGGLIIAIVVILIKSCRSTSYSGLKDVDSPRSLSADKRLATDGNDSSLHLTYSLATAIDRTSSMDTNGKSHEKSTNSSQNKYVYQNDAFNNEDDRVENVCPPSGSNDVYDLIDYCHEKKPSVDKIQPNIDEVRQQDQTYAVVNKTT